MSNLSQSAYLCTLGCIAERLQQLEIARNDIQQILDKLPSLNVSDRSVQFLVPKCGPEHDQIIKGIEALYSGCPKETVRQYFTEGLQAIASEIGDLQYNGERYAREIANSMGMANVVRTNDGFYMIVPNPF